MKTPTTPKIVLTVQQVTILKHFAKLGLLSASPDLAYAALITHGFVEEFQFAVGRFLVPRVRITDAGREHLRGLGVEVRKPSISV